MNKTRKLILLLIFIFVFGSGIVIGIRFFSAEDAWICRDGEWIKHGNPKELKPAGGCGAIETFYEGAIREISPNSFKIETAAGEITVFISSDTKFSEKDGNVLNSDYFRRGFKVLAFGTVSSAGYLTAKEVKIIDEPNIIVFEPKAGDEIGLPLITRGEARVFENNFNYRVRDEDGAFLVENFSTASSPDAGLYGTFAVKTNYPSPQGENGTVEVFSYSPKDGSEINKVIIPVVFKEVEFLHIKAYFSNSKKDPGAVDCSNVYEVVRRVPKTEAAARAALEELLAGPDTLETQDGYFTSINAGVKIQRLVIEDGVAKADFDKTLEQNVGGSCRVAAIRAQIIRTLKQFSTVKDAIISIDGRTEDILQP